MNEKGKDQEQPRQFLKENQSWKTHTTWFTELLKWWWNQDNIVLLSFRSYLDQWSRAESLKRDLHSPGQVAQLVGALPRTPKGCGFHPWTEHICRLWVWSSMGVCRGGNQSKFLSPSLFFPSLLSKNISSGED